MFALNLNSFGQSLMLLVINNFLKVTFVINFALVSVF